MVLDGSATWAVWNPGVLMRRVVTFAVLVPMTVLMIVACGDDEETLTTDEFIEQADAICAAGTTELDDAFAELYGPSGEEPTPEQQTAFVEDTLAPLRDRQPKGGPSEAGP
jgi:hypothetical protein